MWSQVMQHEIEVVAGPEHIDEFGHVSNANYIAWAIDCAWSHSRALGFDYAAYEEAGVGCVVLRHEFDYIGQAKQGDAVRVGTAIINNDGKLRMQRAFELRRADDGALLVKGLTTFVCMSLTTGKAARMPASFVEAYKPVDHNA